MGISFWIETLITNSVLEGLGFRETTIGEKLNRDLKNQIDTLKYRLKVTLSSYSMRIFQHNKLVDSFFTLQTLQRFPAPRFSQVA